MTDNAWVDCAEPGCPNGMPIQWRHVRNFEGRFYCDEHEDTE